LEYHIHQNFLENWVGARKRNSANLDYIPEEMVSPVAANDMSMPNFSGFLGSNRQIGLEPPMEISPKRNICGQDAEGTARVYGQK
jgi:hypothetical protein